MLSWVILSLTSVHASGTYHCQWSKSTLRFLLHTVEHWIAERIVLLAKTPLGRQDLSCHPTCDRSATPAEEGWGKDLHLVIRTLGLALTVREGMQYGLVRGVLPSSVLSPTVRTSRKRSRGVVSSVWPGGEPERRCCERGVRDGRNSRGRSV